MLIVSCVCVADLAEIEKKIFKKSPESYFQELLSRQVGLTKMQKNRSGAKKITEKRSLKVFLT